MTDSVRLSLVLAGRVLISGVLAGLLGLEREIHNKDAGLRTYTLVGLGSALVMVVSQYGFADAALTGRLADPARVAAQVVSGIGFLGGGLIFVKRDVVRGLTTAAGLWLCSGIGLAAGAGMIWMAVLAQVSTLIANAGFNIESVELRREVGEGLVGIRLDVAGTGDVESLLQRISEQPFIVEILPVSRRRG